MTYEIYVISNADLFREGLNAVAAFCHSDGFKAATWMGAALGIIITALAYIKQRDILVYLKWLVSYVFVFNILLGVPSTVAIINTSDQTVPAQVVDHVPFGIALPAHLITAIGYGFSSDLETAFALPTELQYHQTGMLFGSNLFRLSLAAQLDDANIMHDVNNYVRSCVVGDILINHKYTFNDLLHTDDMWGLMIQQPSPIRGIFMQGKFTTCAQAAPILTRKINSYATTTAPKLLARFIPTRNDYAPAAVNTMLASTYQYFKATSKTSTDILRQNIAINAFRAGIKNYAAETGSVAGVETIANTLAMANTRMAWATSRHIGIQTLPLMQVVLLLLLLCVFPLIAVLTLIPGIGFTVFKNYLYSLLWLESWPIMYAILNMAMNFYVRAGHHGSVTLSSINLLAQQHSDIEGIAGYLVLAIPFLSLGLVKGMAFTFNSAAQYLGGMMHAIAQSSATTTAMGNYSLGNVSTNNATANMLQANKHDTNVTHLQGSETQQLGNATLMTTTPMGETIYATSPGMSQLATSAHAAQSAATSLTQQVDRSLTSALTHNTQYLESRGHQESLGGASIQGISTQIDQALSTVNNLTQSLAEKEGISQTDAYQRLSQFSGQFSGQGQIGWHAKKLPISGEGGAGLTVSGSQTSQHSGSYSVGTDENISASEAQDFRDALHTIENYAKTHTYATQNTQAQNLAIQTGADLNKAERLANSAQFIRTHSDAINTNFSQAFANYVQTQHPSEARAILSTTGDSSLLARQQQLADQFIETHATQLANQFAATSVSQGTMHFAERQKYAMQNYQHTTHDLNEKGDNLGMNTEQAQQLKTAVDDKIAQNQQQLEGDHAAQIIQQSALAERTDEDIAEGKSYGQKGVAHHMMDAAKDKLFKPKDE